MIGSLVSLRDWVRDQVSEVRLLATVAVPAAPPRHAPTVKRRRCEETEEHCSHPAAVAMRLAHVPDADSCHPRVWRLCDRHADMTRRDAAGWAARGMVCRRCGSIVLLPSQLVLSETRL